MKIAVLLTCHNRQAKTYKCLQSLKDALSVYNKNTKEQVEIEVYLTDDGCTDGTAEAAREIFPNENVLHILQGDGNLFWAGGMRFCWREAMKRHDEWDYYLLINDDTEMMSNLFDELLGAQKYTVEQFGQEGLISGITCAKEDPTQLTYGGSIWKNRFLATRVLLKPSGQPQSCDLTNANILLVPNKVVNRLGIFYEGFRHGNADYDYSNNARKAGIPIVLTAHFCGRCDRDHLDIRERSNMLISMSLKQRKRYFNNPLHSSDDYLLLIKRISPIRYPFVWLGRALNLYFPTFYYRISGFRK